MNEPEPAPQKNDHPAVWDLVIEDMKQRDQVGQARYGTRLQPHNGRNALIDAYQEALDLVVYLRQLIYEFEGPHMVEFDSSGWAIMHPISCRPNLLGCRVNRAMQFVSSPPPRGMGKYEVRLTDGDILEFEFMSDA